MAVIEDRLIRAIKIVALVLLSVALLMVALMFLSRIAPVVFVLLGAAFLAYLLYPPVHWLQRRRFPRWLAITCVYLVLIVVIGGIGAFVGPRITSDAKALARDFPGVVNQVRDAIVSTHTSYLNAVPIESRESAVKFFDQLVGELQKLGTAIAGRAITLVVNVAAVVTGLVIVPFLAFYILLDLDRLREGTAAMFPARYRLQILSVLKDIDTVVGGFIRGQVIVAIVVALAVTIWLTVMRVKFSLLIGIFAGVADIIPYVGAFAGAIPGVLLAGFHQGWLWALLVALGFVGIYQLEGHLVSPLVVGQRVGLPPLMVIVAILVGAELAGVVGMFVSVPIAALIRVLWMRFMKPTVVVTEPAAAVVPAAAEAVKPVPEPVPPPEPKIIVAKD
jgi:predicted PurR-regulated permease PerM